MSNLKPTKATAAVISKSDLDQLKKDVFKTASPGQVEELEKLGINPSSNDCLVALIYKAFIETRPDDETEPEVGHPLSLVVNLRQRRVPPVPETFFGNMLTLSTTNLKKKLAANNSLFDLAVVSRKCILKQNEEFVQSCVDQLNKMKFFQFYSI